MYSEGGKNIYVEHTYIAVGGAERCVYMFYPLENTYARTYIHVMCAHIREYMCVHKNTYIRTQEHIYTYTGTHTYVRT